MKIIIKKQIIIINHDNKNNKNSFKEKKKFKWRR